MKLSHHRCVLATALAEEVVVQKAYQININYIFASILMKFMILNCFAVL